MVLNGPLRWIVSLSAKFLRVLPILTLVIVLLALIAQITSLLSFFMPLKIIILLGSEGMPRYFPPAFSQIDRNLLIAWLSAATVGFFLLSLLAHKLIDKSIDLGATKLLAKSQKMVLFENQQEFAGSAYQRYSTVLAAGVFISLVLAALGWLYASMAALILGYMFVVFVGFIVSYRISIKFREYFDQSLSVALRLVGNLGFFVIFAYLVVDYLFLSPPGFIIAIISILVGRQVFSQASALVLGLHGLYQKKGKLDALFFHGKVFLPTLQSDEKTIWPLLMPEFRKDWLDAMLHDWVPDWTNADEIVWQHSGTPGVSALCVTDKQDRTYLVKVYETHRNGLATHEITLWEAKPAGLPAADWLAVTEVGQFTALLYQLPIGAVATRKQFVSAQHEIRQRLLTVEPPKALVNRYVRSHPLVSQRLNANLVRRCAVATINPEQEAQLDTFLACLPELQVRLQELPLAFVNPELGIHATWIDTATQQSILFNWGHWSLEPVGAAWPVKLENADGKDLSIELQAAFSVAAEQRPALQEVSVQSASLAALAYTLENACQRQQFQEALVLVGRILNAF